MADHHDSHGDYVHGEMDIAQNQHSFELFALMTKWGSLYIAVGLVFLVLLTCVKGAGFITAAIVAIIVAIVGWLLLKKKADTSH